MMMHKFLVIFGLFLVTQVKAGTSPLCEKTAIVEETCSSSTSFKKISIIPKNIASIENYLWLQSEVSSHQEVYKQKKDLFANMFRQLRDGKSFDKELEPAVKTEIAKTHEDFQTLFNISKSIHMIEARLEICYVRKLCSAYRRVELEDQLVMVQKSKTLLLIKRPLLSHQGFEDFIKKNVSSYVNSEQNPPAATINNLILNASQDTAKALLEKVDTFSKYFSDPNAPILSMTNDKYTEKYLNKLSSMHPEVVDDLLDRFEMNPPPENKKAFLCTLATKRQKERERDAFIKKGIETSLFVAPFLLGPWGRLGVLGVEGALGAKLLRWGMTAKEVEAGSWVARAAAGISSASFQSMEASDLGNKCRGIEQKYFLLPDAINFKALSDCKEAYQDQLLVASMSWVVTLAAEIPGPALKFYNAKFTPQMTQANASASQVGTNLQRSPLTNKEWAKEFKTADQGNFTYMDLSKIERVSDQHMRNLPDDYWKFVGNIYSERLNLTPDEIKGFIKSSQEFASRTKLVVNTSESVKEATTFKGGVGVVISGKSDDLLPLEKAIGKKLARKPGEKSAEIVRLTVSKDADAEKLSKALINQASGIILQDPTIKTVYVYTSKIHRRLYGKLGVNPTSITAVSDRDVLLTLNRADIERLMANTRN